MLIEREWSQAHWIQKVIRLFISLDSSAQDHSNDIKIIKIEQVKPITYKLIRICLIVLVKVKCQGHFLLYFVFDLIVFQHSRRSPVVI